jgi:HlyD family secretion protein
VLADLSGFHVDVAVDEIDVSRLAVGQPVTLTLDALPGLALPGLVESIDPLSTARSAVTSYEVRVTATTSDPRVRSGMSTNADIVVARKTGVLLVPRRAVRSDRGRLVVDLLRDQSLCEQPTEQRPAVPELDQREVTTGLSNEQVIEIASGLDEGACVYVEGTDARLRFFETRGPPGGRN